MSAKQYGFIPRPECMVASGDCFTQGRCLADCKKQAFYEHQRDVRRLVEQVTHLEIRIIRLEQKP